ncbi:Imm50 family immunity protein [Vibrio gazogenes]|uniref:Immunity protein 50 n=1 Tax=Vibrio gazogenes DSM 21264 = NBRC 103151 TaxID=1123492 RepID=A0A1M5A5G6_VIBGA|nr:Imm50 family immunity protein [Vibrio gazogenes]USP13350.1 immunity 50 family protein [Vibrio gazogenes]SHF25357.1 Immunity protein 50 [Vibrio gazogenes DSM 21264] [Vibrio gazogenes DSM 21264 = NBRC 103151]SJN57000.1 hypothetical protein BQ6471_02324 [Vibrio gazogenes]
MYWNELDGTILLSKVFSNPVKVEKIDLMDFCVKRDGPTIIIRFDLIGQVPDLPPKKWGNFNRCQCGINCSGVYNLLVKNIKCSMVCNVEISLGDQNKIHLFSEDGDVEISFHCEHIQFTGPNVYLSE